FYVCPAHPSDLRSFPTRRSSDLEPAAPGEPVTPFSEILRRAVEATPNAIGGAFADADGEMVDSYSTIDAHEWAVLTAHYGVVMRSEEHTSELQSRENLVCRLLLE